MTRPSPMAVRLIKCDHGQDLDLPEHATPQSAGLDLRAAITSDLDLKPGERALVPCGFTMELPEGYEAQIRPRSGLAFKHGITVLNTPGTIDCDYRGEIKVLLINHGQDSFLVERAMRIAQMVVAPYQSVRFYEASTDNSEETTSSVVNLRASGGFGSTGIK